MMAMMATGSVDASKLRLIKWEHMALLLAPNSRALVLAFEYDGQQFGLVLPSEEAALLCESIISGLEQMGYSCEPIGEAVH